MHPTPPTSPRILFLIQPSVQHSWAIPVVACDHIETAVGVNIAYIAYIGVTGSLHWTGGIDGPSRLKNPKPTVDQNLPNTLQILIQTHHQTAPLAHTTTTTFTHSSATPTTPTTPHHHGTTTTSTTHSAGYQPSQNTSTTRPYRSPSPFTTPRPPTYHHRHNTRQHHREQTPSSPTTSSDTPAITRPRQRRTTVVLTISTNTKYPPTQTTSTTTTTASTIPPYSTHHHHIHHKDSPTAIHTFLPSDTQWHLHQLQPSNCHPTSTIWTLSLTTCLHNIPPTHHNHPSHYHAPYKNNWHWHKTEQRGSYPLGRLSKASPTTHHEPFSTGGHWTMHTHREQKRYQTQPQHC